LFLAGGKVCKSSPSCVIFLLQWQFQQGWLFAMAKSIFARTVEKTGKNRQQWQKPGKKLLLFTALNVSIANY
jgi:hypothetical protein